jgi:hypothetical protein
MSHDHFHVHGPHDHELEHAAQHGGSDRLAGQLAVITAIIATIGAFFSYMGGLTQTNAELAKANAAIRSTEASDQWNFFQAKNNRQAIAELGLDVAPDARKPAYQQTIAKMKSDKDEIMKKAHELEEQGKGFDEQSEHLIHQHHRWAAATTLLQVSIAMAAITLLTRRKWLMGLTIAVAGVGALIGVAAAMGV